MNQSIDEPHAYRAEAHYQVTIERLCLACGTDEQTIEVLVHEGVLDVAGNRPQDWRFDAAALARARRAVRLMRELHVNAAGVALALDLMDEIARLRAQLRSLRP
ncbi:chaperone modulator CbpM [Caldimonas aquatica]|uniref:Chaperone modulator CbpM n=1 Tax=Caldimonas aquatica TaxID=376175 RepID=A0ABY6MWK1_9BURK|nr:chaperone modulator CbpM [Schlegelella aquatica]UZD56398.1 chaperone modulator CbpM [Schlegelella aquatica]